MWNPDLEMLAMEQLLLKTTENRPIGNQNLLIGSLKATFLWAPAILSELLGSTKDSVSDRQSASSLNGTFVLVGFLVGM